MGVYISRIWGEETPERIEPSFFLVKDIYDVITHAKFGDDRLRGSGVVAGQISAFPITLLVVLTTLSHYRVSV